MNACTKNLRNRVKMNKIAKFFFLSPNEIRFIEAIIINFIFRSEVICSLFAFVNIANLRSKSIHMTNIVKIFIKKESNIYKIGFHQFLARVEATKPFREQKCQQTLNHCKCISWLGYFHYLVVSCFMVIVVIVAGCRRFILSCHIHTCPRTHFR